MRISRPVPATAGASVAPSAAAILAAVLCSDPDGSASACKSCRSATAAPSSAARPARSVAASSDTVLARRAALPSPGDTPGPHGPEPPAVAVLVTRSCLVQPVDPVGVGRSDERRDSLGIRGAPGPVSNELPGDARDVAAEAGRAEVVQL